MLDSVHEHENILALQEADAFNVILSELFAVVIYQVVFQLIRTLPRALVWGTKRAFAPEIRFVHFPDVSREMLGPREAFRQAACPATGILFFTRRTIVLVWLSLMDAN